MYYKKILYNGCSFMSLENEFHLLYIYSYRKISLTACGVFRKASVA